MASIKNLIHYHDNLDILSKITDENLKVMIKEIVDLTIEETITNMVNKKVEEMLANFVIPEHTHNYNDLENKPIIPNIEDLATIDYVNECLDEKKLVYLTVAEYEALSEEEKNRDNIVYNIIQE